MQVGAGANGLILIIQIIPLELNSLLIGHLLNFDILKIYPPTTLSCVSTLFCLHMHCPLLKNKHSYCKADTIWHSTSIRQRSFHWSCRKNCCQHIVTTTITSILIYRISVSIMQNICNENIHIIHFNQCTFYRDLYLGIII